MAWGWGYGHPSSLPDVPAGTSLDWGYGSPTPVTWDAAAADSGYGSPVTIVLPYIYAPAAAYPDDGGCLVRLVAPFTDPGPYYVRLINAASALFPPTVNCYSGVIGQADACYPDPTGESLVFALPPVPPGIYTIRLRYGPSLTSEILVPDALIIKTRMRSPATYRLRSVLPPPYATGARSIRQEPALP